MYWPLCHIADPIIRGLAALVLTMLAFDAENITCPCFLAMEWTESRFRCLPRCHTVVRVSEW